MKNNVFDRLISFLDNLEQEKINYTLAYNRDNAIMVIIVVPGERWEVEFLDDGSVEVERFISNGEIYGESALSELFTRYSEQEHDRVELPQDIELMVVVE